MVGLCWCIPVPIKSIELHPIFINGEEGTGGDTHGLLMDFLTRTLVLDITLLDFPCPCSPVVGGDSGRLQLNYDRTQVH